MSPTTVSSKTEVVTDLLAKKILEAIVAVENIRAEKDKLAEQVESLQHANIMLESEVESLRLALENEQGKVVRSKARR